MRQPVHPLPEMLLQGQCYSPGLAHAIAVGAASLPPCLPGESSDPPANWSWCWQGGVQAQIWEPGGYICLPRPRILGDQGAESGLLGPRSQVSGLGPLLVFSEDIEGCLGMTTCPHPGSATLLVGGCCPFKPSFPFLSTWQDPLGLHSCGPFCEDPNSEFLKASTDSISQQSCEFGWWGPTTGE